MGHYINVNHATRLVTIHVPTDRWQHRPREGTPAKCGFWVGPLESVRDAQDAAQEIGEQLDYPVHRCRTCFHVPRERARDRRKRERASRSIWPWVISTKSVQDARATRRIGGEYTQS